MPVEVTEVKEIRIRWASSEAVIYAGSLKMIPIAQSPTITLAEQVVKDPNGFVEYAQRIADALNESKPKEPRKARKDKGEKRKKTFYPPLGDVPVDIEKQFLPENNPVDKGKDILFPEVKHE